MTATIALLALAAVVLLATSAGLHTTAAQPGAGATLMYSATSGGSYVAIALGVEITGPDPTVEKIDTSILTSTIKTSRPGVPDPGEVSMTGFCDPADATHEAMIAYLYAPAIVFFKLNYGDVQQTTDAFSGYLTKFTRNNINIDNNIGYDMAVAVTSAVVTTHGNPTG